MASSNGSLDAMGLADRPQHEGAGLTSEDWRRIRRAADELRKYRYGGSDMYVKRVLTGQYWTRKFDYATCVTASQVREAGYTDVEIAMQLDVEEDVVAHHDGHCRCDESRVGPHGYQMATDHAWAFIELTREHPWTPWESTQDYARRLRDMDETPEWLDDYDAGTLKRALGSELRQQQQVRAAFGADIFGRPWRFADLFGED